MVLERINPPDMYQPYENFYTQVIKATGATQVHIAGTVALDEQRNLVGEGQMDVQVAKTMENIGKSLAAAGATPADVVRVNIFTIDVDAYLMQGHAKLLEFFGGNLPVSTLAGISRLVDKRYLVEIQATAIID